MQVTVTVKDADRITTYQADLPDEQTQELHLATATIRNMQPAEVFLRMCSLGLDVFLKEYGNLRLKFMVSEFKRLLDMPG
jgi:hypothetical protein